MGSPKNPRRSLRNLRKRPPRKPENPRRKDEKPRKPLENQPEKPERPEKLKRAENLTRKPPGHRSYDEASELLLWPGDDESRQFLKIEIKKYRPLCTDLYLVR